MNGDLHNSLAVCPLCGLTGFRKQGLHLHIGYPLCVEYQPGPRKISRDGLSQEERRALVARAEQEAGL